MKKRIILLLAALMALLQCAEWGFEYDNPLDERGLKNNGGNSEPSLVNYTVTFNANGGAGEIPPDVTVSDGNDIKLPAKGGMSNGNMDFDGWNTEANGTGATYPGGSTYTVTGDITLYAKWNDGFTPTTYTIIFNANEGNGTAPNNLIVNAGSSVTLPGRGTLARDGYEFSGWNTHSSGTGYTYAADASYTPTASIELFAKWNDNSIPQHQTYTLTIAANPSDGGTVSPSVGAHTYDAGVLVTVTATANSGYTFTNWSGESSSTNATIDVAMDGHKTLTANFGQQSYCVAYPTALECGSGTTFTDSRDGKKYKKVVIDTQTWMGENLNYNASGSVCYGNSADSCAQYGRLYNWATAMDIDASYNSTNWNGSDVNHLGACPVGWHVPSDAEWTALENYVGYNAGTKLKSSTGWNSYSGGPVGTDLYGFAALPGGYGEPDGGFNGAGDIGYWWSATEYNANNARDRNMLCCLESVDWDNNNKTGLFSVRCVQD